MNTFVEIKHWDHEAGFIPVSIGPADTSLTWGRRFLETAIKLILNLLNGEI